MHHAKMALLAAATAMALFGCNQKASEKGGATVNTAETNETGTRTAAVDHSDPLASAAAAAPEAIGSKATIVQAQADGAMKTLREGSNGWTCMPDNPQTPGHDPMCMDANGLKWAQAWMAHKD